ncbi:protein-disulfide reductase DsbD family protein [Alteromonas ponticola]|uniref:Thiol:disulfide interchange protein n=1 Tax=Alteromonas ponticola TaxID=2720613 RepID=A0ABX1R5E6_9ALTE|nr:protein-disulfide reductase DsbD domain-containing protein [Alteromonas ponticola]NMH60983.1 hypothetical protein [Alteromonas ponticola]
MINHIKLSCLFLWLICFHTVAEPTARNTDQATQPHIQVRLVSEFAQLKPGVNWFGIWLRPDPEWHTYWRNPGDSGEPPKIDWILPEGVSAGEIQWPLPSKIPIAHLVNYGYENHSLLMVPLTLSDEVKYGATLDISADLSWLVCKEDCIPGWATLTKTLKVASDHQPSAQAGLFDEAREQLPDEVVKSARYEITDNKVVLQLNELLPDGDWLLFPFSSSILNHAGAIQHIETAQSSTFVGAKSDYFTPSQNSLRFLVSDGQTGFYVKAQMNNAVAGEVLQAKNVSATFTYTTILVSMAMAFIGGVILNLMPCVLPILSIKALSMQRTSQSTAVKLAYASGVLVSFSVFALIIIAFKHSGSTLGWGFHMQSPVVVAALAFLFTFIAAALFDMAPAGNRLAGIGQGFIQQNGFTSQFATGVLAVVVASPCTAPFMAAALGVALVSSDMITLAIFLSLGLGFALPLSVLFWLPGLTRKIPKPGPWMSTFRQFLAFPMLATVIWLLWVFGNQTSPMAMMALLGGLLILFFALWLYRRTQRTFAHVAALMFAVSGFLVPLFVLTSPSTDSQATTLAFNKQQLAALRQDNQVVIVNMTADWCITCKVNEQVAFTSSAFTQALAQPQVHYMVGDWTNKNDEILGYLNQYQRSGVPLYVVYAGEQSKEVLPQILTPDLVVKAITKAVNEVNDEN